MKAIYRSSILLALALVVDLAANPASANGYGGYTISGAGPGSASGSSAISGSGAYSVSGSSAYSVSGTSAYTSSRKSMCNDPRYWYPYGPCVPPAGYYRRVYGPDMSGADYYALGAGVYK